jgi:para-nitrobenzyl esterase
MVESDPPYPIPAKPGAFHGAELPYVFNHLDALKRPWQAWDRKLADVMSSYWVNFAKTGDPNGKGLASWPAYDENNEQVMQFADKVGAAPLPLKAVVDCLDPYLSKPVAR